MNVAAIRAALLAMGLLITVTATHANSLASSAPVVDAPPPSDSALVSPIGDGETPKEPWRLALLPRQSKPVTQFRVVDLQGERVLRVAASKSYGKLLHPVSGLHSKSRKLKWQWRVDHAPSETDLRKRAGDDVAMRVCAFFDWPTERLPAVDRARLAMAELIAGEVLPTAALCYVWDGHLPTGTVMPNAFSRRIRMIVVDGEGTSLGEWREHARDLHKDFRTAFADEWRDGDDAPPVRAVIIGADTDNTVSDALGYLRGIGLGVE